MLFSIHLCYLLILFQVHFLYNIRLKILFSVLASGTQVSKILSSAPKPRRRSRRPCSYICVTSSRSMFNVLCSVIQALSLINLFKLVETSSQSIILTGKAGTGKSTFIEYLRNYSLKKIQILAFTGVAAIKGRGRTIHSFFKLPHRIPNKKKDYKKLRNNFWINALDIIVIDEVSMVRADLLDAIDRSLRLNRKKQVPFTTLTVNRGRPSSPYSFYNFSS